MSNSILDGKKLKIAFIHPDLGIGGAERLVVDAALGLQQDGHDVIIYTSHCDINHCFEEVKDGTLKVEVYGDFFPTNLFGKFFIVFANLRQTYLALRLLLSGKAKKYNTFIIDQLSSCIPLLHLNVDSKILFYCHFPDQLLAMRTNLLKKLYRIPFDLFEQFTISAADQVVVNSNFTKQMYFDTFTWLNNVPDVIYPCVDIAKPNIDPFDKELFSKILEKNDRFYLSINRYERKKDILLALKAFAYSNESEDTNCKLIICGGYDDRVTENVEYLKELHFQTKDLKLTYTTISYTDIAKSRDLKKIDASSSQVVFLTSISSSLKELLLSKTEMLLYTPANEHFGIVPLEAMKHGKPVLACNSGGPVESVVTYVAGHNEDTCTGWLRDPAPMIWAKALNEFKVNKKVDFKANGKRRVQELFSRQAMTKSFESAIEKIYYSKKPKYAWENLVLGICHFSVHMIILRLFSDPSYAFLCMAIGTYLCFRNITWSIYWIFLFSMTYDP